MAESEYCHPEGNVDGTLSRGHESYSDGTSVVYCNDMMAWHIVQIKDVLHTTVNYSGKYFTSFGAMRGASDGFGNVLTFNHGFWHQVCPGITLK
ncbi:hypothetical protein ACM0P6_06700 [Komagataeibacter sucrofermentans]|uniref:hypothetical protein n=1 Tax=Komagataeibacter sucrofermentans TaxID=1053551 RepID=UPI001ABFCF92|nr:hypothetical protein [Komagataeibacter sucrofermentans]GBQ50526.1 hypothetical protein AA15973_2127 [Komagataeibacter sucrofermentans DSM 15973]